MDWNPDYRYKVLGKMVQANGKALIAFDLTSSECFPKVVNRDGKKVSSRQSVFAEQWSGKFGPPILRAAVLWRSRPLIITRSSR